MLLVLLVFVSIVFSVFSFIFTAFCVMTFIVYSLSCLNYRPSFTFTVSFPAQVSKFIIFVVQRLSFAFILPLGSKFSYW